VARITPTPPENTYRSRAAVKRNAAIRHEREAARLRADAELLERKWAEYIARYNAEKRSA
jgi:hypothetical protein